MYMCVYIYIYIYIYVCVCVCVWARWEPIEVLPRIVALFENLGVEFSKDRASTPRRGLRATAEHGL